ncbi:MAG TPA: hypothetical protein VFR86_30815, partial [Burkholderiaceae bacterium]|nr:hypothetical protein [Burkholderiaceae bacterium]
MPHDISAPRPPLKTPSDRAFGFVFAVFFGAVGALPLVWMAPPRGWGFALGIAFALAALFAPRLLG